MVNDSIHMIIGVLSHFIKNTNISDNKSGLTENVAWLVMCDDCCVCVSEPELAFFFLKSNSGKWIKSDGPIMYGDVCMFVLRQC